MSDVVEFPWGRLRDPVEFLRARLDAQEAAIIYYRDGHPGEPCTNDIDGDPTGAQYSEWDSCERHIKAADGTPYRDAEFGLADIAAKRRILGEYVAACSYYDANRSAPAGEVHGLRTAVLHLAAPFSTHPDYDPTWAVSTS